MECYNFTDKLLLNKTTENQSVRFYRHSIFINSNYAVMDLTLTVSSITAAQIPIALFDPDGNVRLLLASEGGKGDITTNYHIASTHSSPGCINGPIIKGEWHLILYKRRFNEDLTFTLKVECKRKIENIKLINKPNYTFSDKVINDKPGWYNGELHVHSNHSTGRSSISEILEIAKERSLNFIAITDHFTASHWQELEEISPNDILALQSIEISGDYGHSNLHGIKTWQNPFIDDNEELTSFLNLKQRQSIESITDSAHREGGLMSLNHMLSGLVAWRYHSFPLIKADLMEVWCTSDNETAFLYPTLWDSYLKQGYRLIGVGSSDSHKATDHPTWSLGQIRTWIYASSLSQKGIIDGLKRGNVYISYGNATLEFYAISNNKKYDMGSCITYCSDIEFTVEISNHTSGNLFIYIDGQLDNVVYFDENEGVDKHSFIVNKDDFSLKKDINSYVRIEFHEDLVKARFFGMAHRDSKTMRLLSNPIWISKEMI